MRCVASGLGLASAITVDSCTPSHWTSIFDQVVTQWKSLVSLTWGRARKSFQESRTGSSTAPSTSSSHLEILMSGWRPSIRGRRRLLHLALEALAELHARLHDPTLLLVHGVIVRAHRWKGCGIFRM